MLDERMKKHPGFIAYWGSTKKDSVKDEEIKNEENKEDKKDESKPEK